MVLGKLESHIQNNKTRLEFVLMNKINSKWIKEPNIRSEAINYVEEIIVTKLIELCLEDFIDLISKAREVKINEWDSIKFYSYMGYKTETHRYREQYGGYQKRGVVRICKG